MIKKKDYNIMNSDENFILFFHFYRLLEIIKNNNFSDLSAISKTYIENFNIKDIFFVDEEKLSADQVEKILSILWRYGMISITKERVMITEEGKKYLL